MISIIMATYNRAKTLPRAIESVLSQTVAEWELVIVDDGSVDETGDILARYHDDRIHVLRHAANRGVTAARNTGLENISGDWFAMLDSDDELVPEALEVLYETASRTGAEAITCNCADSQTGALTGHGWDAEGWKLPDEWRQVSGEHWGVTRTALLGGLRFDERLPGYEGVLWSKITARAGRRYYLHRALRIYHTEGTERVTQVARGRSLAERLRIYVILSEDAGYLEALGKLNPEKRCRIERRGRLAWLVLRTRIMDVPVIRRLRPRQLGGLVAVGGVVVLAIASIHRARQVSAKRPPRRVRRRRPRGAGRRRGGTARGA